MRSISWMIALVIAVLMVASSTVFGVFIVERLSSRVEQDISSRLAEAKRLLGESVQGEVDRMQVFAAAFSEIDGLAEAVRDGDVERIEALGRDVYQRARDDGVVSNLALVERPATIVYRFQRPDRRGDDVSQRRWDMLETGRDGRTRGGLVAQLDSLGIVGVQPLTVEGQLVGAMTAGRSFSQEALERIAARAGVEIVLHQPDADGTLTQTIGSDGAASIVASTVLRTAFDQDQHQIQDVDRGDRSLSVSTAQLLDQRGDPMAVIEVIMDTTDAMSASRQLTTVVVTAALLIALIGIIAGIVAGRGIARPIQRLEQRLREVDAGDLDSAVPGTGRSDEIGAMAQVMGSVLDNLKLAAQDREEAERIKAAADATRREDLRRLAEDFEKNVGTICRAVSTGVGGITVTASQIGDQAATSLSSSREGVGSSERIAENIQTIAAASDQLSASIGEISQQVAAANNLSAEAVDFASSTEQASKMLAERITRIGETVTIIAQIAEQTNLLALNATIEAARAGEAGKGFAVVAQEVKALATQTARATEEIDQQMRDVVDASHETNQSIEKIGVSISDMRSVYASISAAVEEQSVSTSEISRNVSNTAEDMARVSVIIQDVESSAMTTETSVSGMKNAMDELASQSDYLLKGANDFVSNVRVA